MHTFDAFKLGNMPDISEATKDSKANDSKARNRRDALETLRLKKRSGPIRRSIQLQSHNYNDLFHKLMLLQGDPSGQAGPLLQRC